MSFLTGVTDDHDLAYERVMQRALELPEVKHSTMMVNIERAAQKRFITRVRQHCSKMMSVAIKVHFNISYKSLDRLRHLL